MKKILINRTDAIGDTLLTTSLARSIKKLSSDYTVDFLVSERCEYLINHCDGVDNAFILKTKSPKKEQKRFLKKLFTEQKYDYYFHLGGSFLPTYVAFLSKVPVRSGILSKVQSYLFLNKKERR